MEIFKIILAILIWLPIVIYTIKKGLDANKKSN